MRRGLKKLDLNIKYYLLNSADHQEPDTRSKDLSKLTPPWERPQSIKKDTPLREIKHANLDLEKSNQNLQPSNSEEHNGISLQSVEMDEWVSFFISNQQKFMPRPFFFQENQNQHKNGLGKLLCFNFTNKNKTFVKFSSSSLTCKPIYQCYGCNIIFESPSALGGHLSKCYNKRHHFIMIKRLRKSQSLAEELSAKKATVKHTHKIHKISKNRYQNQLQKKRYRQSQQQISEKEQR